MAEFVTVAKTGEIPAGEGRVVEAGGRQIALFNVDGEFHALDNTCLHRGGPLGEGELAGKVVTCPWHGWTYDVSTGEVTFNPTVRVEKLQVRVEGDSVQVAI